MQLSVIGLPHTRPTDKYSWCAYTQKTRRFVDMMRSLGHDVTVVWGDDMDGEMPEFTPDNPVWQKFNRKCIRKLKKRSGYLCVTMGTCQLPVAEALPNLVPVEVGVGYGGTFADFCVFESYAWMHTVYGAKTGGDAHAADGRYYDTVIPNAYDVDEFPLGDGRGDYLLYIGRNIERKGVVVAEDTAERTGLELITVGPGFDRTVGAKERAQLMGDARAVMVPTQYVEPFGGVHVEAMLCGTPVLTTDWGAFTETVQDGINGFRCRTLAEFCSGVERAPTLSRDYIRALAQSRFSTTRVARQYDDYFNRLETLRAEGWYS